MYEPTSQNFLSDIIKKVIALVRQKKKTDEIFRRILLPPIIIPIPQPDKKNLN